MRGMLVVNPNATTTSPRVTHVITSALSSELDLSVERTGFRGHGMALARRARDEGFDVVITLGGDGIVNEAVNGLMADGPDAALPALATIPGGSANVFARALGLPVDPVEATGEILDRLRDGRARRIGLGRVRIEAAGAEQPDRWFAVNAGLGLDAAIIAAMEEQRGRGARATPARYLATTLREYATATDREHPAVTLLRPGGAGERVFVAIVQNTSPWSFFGPLPIDPCPHASFDTGLDVFGVRSLSWLATAKAARRILARTPSRANGRTLLGWHDQAAFEAVTSEPVPMQIDGEGIGPVTAAAFTAVPQALTVIQ